MKNPPRFVSLLVLLSANLCPLPCPASAGALPDSVTPVASAQVYEDPAKGFAFDVPAGWTVSKSGDSLLVNNQRPGLNIIYWGSTGLAAAGPIRSPDKPPEKILQLLHPGEIWLKLTSSAGDNREPDTAVSEINVGLASPIAPTANPDLLRLSFSFYKHGHWFDCVAFLRAPVSDEEKGKLRTMLQNLRFIEQPVSNLIWATSLARQSLPTAVRDIKEPPVGRPDRMPPRTVSWSTQSLEDAFSVTFTLNTVPPGLGAPYKAGAIWKFRVSFDGTVTPQSLLVGSAPTPSPDAATPNAAQPGN